MKDRQRGLFGRPAEPAPPAESAAAAPPPPSPLPARTAELIAAFKRRPWHFLLITFGIYAVLGELILPQSWRFSTFLGTRLGNIEGSSIRESAPAAASAACQKMRQELAQQLYAQCISDLKATGSRCNAMRDQALKSPC